MAEQWISYRQLAATSARIPKVGVVAHCFPSDLTGDTACAQDPRAPVATDMAADVPTRMKSPELPVGWVPDGARVHVFALFDPDSRVWESMTPEFSIAGMGDSADEAIENALELLRDYLYLCAREGRTFKDSYRGIDWRWALSASRSLVSLWLRERRGQRVRHAHPPLASAH